MPNCWRCVAKEVAMCSRLKEKILLAIMASTAQETSGKRRRGSAPCATFQATCSWCELPVLDFDKASGWTGRGSDPINFPHCAHALHAACLRAWDYGKSTPEQRRLLDKRRAPRYAKLCRATALVSYDDNFGGKCHKCAADDAAS